MNFQSKAGYFIISQTLNIALCKRDGITDRKTDKGTDGRTIRLLDAPDGPFRPGHKNSKNTTKMALSRSEPEYEAEGYFQPRTEADILYEAVQVQQMFLQCVFEGRVLNCADEFQPVIMEVGVCFTFNKNGTFSTSMSGPVNNLFLYINVNELDMTWGLDFVSGIKVSSVKNIPNYFLYKKF